MTTAADLAEAVRTQAIRHLAGLSDTVEQAIAAALPDIRPATSRISIGRAIALSTPILDRLRSMAVVVWASEAGSLRRGQETVGDIEIVAATTTPTDAIDAILRLPSVDGCVHRSDRRVHLVTERVQISVRMAEPINAGAMLLHLTGSAGHLAALRRLAENAGARLTPDGLWAADGTRRPSATEDEIYGALGLQLIPPEIREGSDEIEAASSRALPAFLSRRDIRGDLHMHTEFSDGRHSVQAMVETCRALGYEYLAITDHSPSSAASRNLSVGSLSRQADEIDRLRERYPEIAILHGCEVDILPNGRLDFPDRLLERLDIVLASLHDDANQSSAELLQRYIGAMAHPLVAMITHPTNRVVPHRPGYDLDYDTLFEVAADTGTLVEIDGAPSHLDLDGHLARRAIAAGVTLAVDSDCHNADLLARQMALGVTTARRGWVERRHVVNTRPLAEVKALIAAKRAG